MNLKKIITNLLRLIVVFLACLIMRFPYLFGDHLFFDGDEAVLGIMARDLLQTKGFPVFFYGQQYGFSLLEAIAGMLWMPFLGQTVWSLKLGGILIFSFGIYQLMEIPRRKELSLAYQALVLLVAASFSPWLIWATKLRGGYLTAFWFFCVIIQILFTNTQLSKKIFVKLGILLALIYFSQPLFLIPLFPILVFRTLKEFRVQYIFVGMVSSLIVFMILKIFALQNPNYWRPTVFAKPNLEHLKTFFITNFWSYYSGNYLYVDSFPVDPLVELFSLIVISIFGSVIILFIAKIKNLSFQKNSLELSEKKVERVVSPASSADETHVSSNLLTTLFIILGLILSVGSIVFFDMVNGRYALSFFSLLLVMLILVFNDLPFHFPKFSILLLLSIVFFQLGIASRYDKSFTSYWLAPEVNDMQALDELMAELKKRDLKYLYTTDWFLMWQINYLGNEEIHCRHKSISDRVDRYAKKVNECEKDVKCKTALVGTHFPLLYLDTHPKWKDWVEKLNARYYILENPPRELLKIGEYE